MDAAVFYFWWELEKRNWNRNKDEAIKEIRPEHGVDAYSFRLSRDTLVTQTEGGAWIEDG